MRRFSRRTTNPRLEFDDDVKSYAVRCHARSLRTEQLIQRIKYIAQHDAVVPSVLLHDAVRKTSLRLQI
jgi:hypothetical protein